MSSGSLNTELTKKTSFFGLKLWVVIGICIGVFIVGVLCLLSVCVTFRRKSRRTLDKYSHCKIPNISKDITVDRIDAPNAHDHPESVSLTVNDKSSEKHSEKMTVHLGRSKSSDTDNISQSSSSYRLERGCSSQSGEEGSYGTVHKQSSYVPMPSPLVGLPEFSQLGWGHWFMLRDLEHATNHFSAENVIGEGGYGIVYRGQLINGSEVAVKKLLNNYSGQAEKEFRVEVEAIGHVRHKNLVRLLGYCIEGVHRMLVYEYVNNGNLEQWLHGAMRQHGTLTWEGRMKVLLGTAKALAYLHESIEPKVVHRDIKSSNILIDDEFNAKVSDFGLAKLLDSGESHITTRVMGTFGYVAPEYANSGLLNEKSDIYSFGVLLLEAVTGRDPVDYGRPANEVNLVEWLKTMVGNRRAEEVVDPNLEVKPSTRSLKHALLVALRCVDPDSEKRPKMSQVAQMLEADEFPYREDRRNRSRTASIDIESTKDSSSSQSVDVESGVGKSDTSLIIHG
ncbi:PREDICTED: probable receptor-like protein kinase At2g42960 isoform X1 [Ipomoea nil]|uniref:probable receptor-like protein kinase At2g42960 isoform X1 n=1 Tax=Ipomoea nil TaxID=35883 RepID=UPI00090136F4|nr:PREDICTED: probable receptor-like protein kinase At2g42960 isoform X1 [Ipomoea nil]XP_019193531.1 PREDICTED: probable receptor-like protein kinase At2g42960 isoform X1 [Ipomoea nil]XP_019193532.1 PREDICTED: probable receptor-like protein kinase At2g42960 isoform X1 [Ipomoea nil]